MKMLMEIDPLPMRGSLVMMMVMISPPGGKFPRQNSSAGALDWFRQGSASWRRSLAPKGCLMSHPRAGCGPPGLNLWRQFFFIYFKMFRGVLGLMELRRIGL